MKKILSSIIAIALLANACTVGALANEDLQRGSSTKSYVEIVNELDSKKTDKIFSKKGDVTYHKDVVEEKRKNSFGITTEIMGEDAVIYGDLNGDEGVDLQDVVELQKHLADLVKLGDNALKAADVNLDVKVNLEDVTTMQKYIAKLIPHLPYNSENSSTTDNEAENTIDYKLNSTHSLLKSLFDIIESDFNVKSGKHYTEESYKLFKENYDKVKGYLDAYDQEDHVDYDNNQLLSLYAQLRLSYDYLELTTLGELRSLIDIVSHSQEYFNPNIEFTGKPMFTEEAVKNLKKYLFKAYDVYNASKDGEYDEDDIYKALSDLEDAFYAMECDSYTSLSIVLGDLSTHVENADLYTEDSFQVFFDAYEKAKDMVSSDEILTDGDYDSMWDELFNAYFGLEFNAKGRISYIYGMFTYGDDGFCHSFYTDESLEPLKELCTKDYHNMAQLTDEQIEELADKMDQAFENLEYSPFSLALDMVYAGRGMLESETLYTEESMSAFKTAYDAVYDFVMNPGKYSDEDATTLIENMDTCLENLEEDPYESINMYYQSLLMYKDLEESELDMYTKDYLDKVNSLIEKVEAYLADPSSVNGEDAKKLLEVIEEILFCEEYTPYGNLYSTLTFVSSYAIEGNEFGFYTEESFKKFCDLFEEANNIILDYKNYTDEQFTEIEEKLLEAFDNLELSSVGKLLELYSEGEIIIEMNNFEPICLEESLTTLINVLEEVGEYVNYETPITEEKASELLEKLEAAINEVEYTMEYAFSAAQATIDSLEAYYDTAKEGNFTEWVEAFDQLKELISDPEKTTSREIIELLDLLRSLTLDLGIPPIMH